MILQGFIIILIGAATVALVVSPFFRKKKLDEAVFTDQYEKDHLLTQLADLEYDYQMRKVSKKDYEQIRQVLIRQYQELLAHDEAAVQKWQEVISREVKSRLDAKERST